MKELVDNNPLGGEFETVQQIRQNFYSLATWTHRET